MASSTDSSTGKITMQLNDREMPLVVFEMANNHMGSVDHGLATIEQFAEVASNYPFDFAFKFQFRQLDSFIHPDFKERHDLKYVKRFSETELEQSDFEKMFDRVRNNNLHVLVTPFDNDSVDVLADMDVDALKVASCSLTDWPLLERIAQMGKPTVVSTAGGAFEQIDQVVSFFGHRERSIAMMHCVGEYPTTASNLQLGQISQLIKRYPGVSVGYSTHEQPDNFSAVPIALGLGARIFEKHVAVETEHFKKNDYSVTPTQMKAWLDSLFEAYQMLGETQERHKISAKEKQDLRQFQRGVFLRSHKSPGSTLRDEDVFFAFPCVDGQLVANDWSKYMRYRLEVSKEEKTPLMSEDVEIINKREMVYKICQEVKSLLDEAGVVYPGGVELEISHHYGIERFKETGIAMLTVVNREYCKKIIVVLPGQKHPEQYHKQKEETFHVLHGSLKLILNGEASQLSVGEAMIVEPGTRHAFETDTGCVLEEISTSHYQNDSFYTDPAITNNLDRKTILKYWFD